MMIAGSDFMMVEKIMQIKNFLSALDDNDCEDGWNVDANNLMVIKIYDCKKNYGCKNFIVVKNYSYEKIL